MVSLVALRGLQRKGSAHPRPRLRLALHGAATDLFFSEGPTRSPIPLPFFVLASFEAPILGFLEHSVGNCFAETGKEHLAFMRGLGMEAERRQ